MGLTASTTKKKQVSIHLLSLTVYTFPSFFCVSCGYPLLLSNSIYAKHALSYPTVYYADKTSRTDIQYTQKAPCPHKIYALPICRKQTQKNEIHLFLGIFIL